MLGCKSSTSSKSVSTVSSVSPENKNIGSGFSIESDGERRMEEVLDGEADECACTHQVAYHQVKSASQNAFVPKKRKIDPSDPRVKAILLRKKMEYYRKKMLPKIPRGYQVLGAEPKKEEFLNWNNDRKEFVNQMEKVNKLSVVHAVRSALLESVAADSKRRL